MRLRNEADVRSLNIRSPAGSATVEKETEGGGRKGGASEGMCGGWSGVEGVKEAKKTRKICGFDAGISPWGTAGLAGDPEHFHKRLQRSPRRPFFSRTPLPPPPHPHLQLTNHLITTHHHLLPACPELGGGSWDREEGREWMKQEKVEIEIPL